MRNESSPPIGRPDSSTPGVTTCLLLLVAALLVLIPGIHVSLFDRDEGWYAQVSREMLASGDWLTPHYLGKVWLAKPPLLYWLVAGTFRILGVGEWQARIVPVGASCLSVLLTASLAARMFDRRTGVIAGLLLLTFGLFSIVGKMLLTDSVMLACTLTAILFHWEMRDRMTWTRSIVYWLMIGLGVLAKGPATLVFAGAFAVGLYISGWRKWFRDLRYWMWLPMAIVVAAPWYVLMARKASGTFVQQFLWTEILSRIVEAPHGHTGPPGYYLLISLVGLLPWTAFIPGCIIAAIASRRDARFKLLLVWLGVPWIILEVIRSKLPHYILPCYVPLAILLAVQLSAAWDRHAPLKTAPLAERRVLNLWAQVMVVFGLGLIVAGFVLKVQEVRLPLIALGSLLVVAFILAADALRRATTAAGFRIAVIGTIAFHVALGLWVLPALEPKRLSRQIAREVNVLADPVTPAIICGYEEPTMFFYLDKLPRCAEPGDVAALLKGPNPPLVLAIAADSETAPSIEHAIHWVHPPASISGLNYVKMQQTVVHIGKITP